MRFTSGADGWLKSGMALTLVGLTVILLMASPATAQTTRHSVGGRTVDVHGVPMECVVTGCRSAAVCEQFWEICPRDFPDFPIIIPSWYVAGQNVCNEPVTGSFHCCRLAIAVGEDSVSGDWSGRWESSFGTAGGCRFTFEEKLDGTVVAEGNVGFGRWEGKRTGNKITMHTAGDNNYEYWVEIEITGPNTMTVNYRGYGHRGNRQGQNWTGVAHLTR